MIVGCAVRYKGLTITLPRPARHSEILHQMHYCGLPTTHDVTLQGFVTDRGHFVDRKWAV